MAAVLRGELRSGNETFDLSFVKFDATWPAGYDQAKYFVFTAKLTRLIEAMLERSVGMENTLTCDEILSEGNLSK